MSQNNANNDLSTTEYARRRKELFEITKLLRNMGADAVMGLPRIAVIGGQSAGKSSLVEAVTGINVPRDSGTCTRCPMECSIRGASSAWSCQISLKRQGENASSVEPFGHSITDKTQVELQIRRAQAAILNPRRDAADFYGKSYEELAAMTSGATNERNMLKFSRDAVVVDIEDPRGTDLFFVDLPGLIQNADQNDIDTVRDLVEEYIAQSETIILVTIPATDDLENQQAVKLARNADPDGERTVGVVTKPDSLTDGDVNAKRRWHKVFRGQIPEHILKLGYYCVKLPSDAERTKYARAREGMEAIAMSYLQSNAPWSELSNISRVGVRALIADISKLLMGIIEKALPDILKKVENLIADCDLQLDGLPELRTVDPATEILRRITAFCKAMQSIIDGTGEDRSFVHKSRAIYQKFAIKVWATAPNFQPFEDTTKYELEVDDEDIFDEEIESVRPGKPLGLYDVRKIIKESTGWELPRNIPYPAKTVLYRRFLDGWTEPSDECFRGVKERLADAIHNQVGEHFGRFKDLESYIRTILRAHSFTIEDSSQTAITQVLKRERSPYFTQNLHYLNANYHKWLARYRGARYTPWKYLLRERDTGVDIPTAPPSPVPASERSYSYGVEAAVFEAPRLYAAPEAPRLYAAPETSPFRPPPQATYRYASPSHAEQRLDPEATALEVLAELGYKGLKKADLERLHPPDQFEEELHVMADVRAYFQVAFKRIIDNIPMTIQHSLCQQLSDTLQEHLIDTLKLSAPDASQKLEELLVEDPELVKRREEVLAKKKKLSEVWERLQNF